MPSTIQLVQQPSSSYHQLCGLYAKRLSPPSDKPNPTRLSRTIASCFYFWRSLQRQKDSPAHTNNVLVFLLVPLELPLDDTNIAFTAKTTYKLHIIYEISATAMHTAHYPLDTGAGANLIRSTTFPSSWSRHITNDNIPHLQTVSKEPLPLEGLNFLHLCFGELCTQVRFGVAPH